jgi:hypothetical protein
LINGSDSGKIGYFVEETGGKKCYMLPLAQSPVSDMLQKNLKMQPKWGGPAGNGMQKIFCLLG